MKIGWPSRAAFIWVMAAGLLTLGACRTAPTASVPAKLESTLSASKLGPHFIGRYTPGGRAIVAAGPRVIKVLDPQAAGGMLEALRDYKARHPGGIVVMRVWQGSVDRRYRLADDPAASADDFWRRVLKPALDGLAPADRALIDYLEGPNEGETTPAWTSVESARWFGRFWTRLAERIAAGGVRPCAASIPVGNPPGSPAEIEARILAFVPALRAVQRVNGAWSYHPYTIQYTTDLEVERHYSLRYRIFYETLRRHHPDLAELPLLLTEGGVDRAGDANQDGWRARGDAAKYQAYLRWWDAELQKDKYVLGATLFQIGDPSGWASFDLEPVALWLAEELRRSR